MPRHHSENAVHKRVKRGRTGQIVAMGALGYYGFTTNGELKIESVENGYKKDKQEIITL